MGATRAAAMAAAGAEELALLRREFALCRERVEGRFQELRAELARAQTAELARLAALETDLAKKLQDHVNQHLVTARQLRAALEVAGSAAAALARVPALAALAASACAAVGHRVPVLATATANERQFWLEAGEPALLERPSIRLEKRWDDQAGVLRVWAVDDPTGREAEVSDLGGDQEPEWPVTVQPLPRSSSTSDIYSFWFYSSRRQEYIEHNRVTNTLCFMTPGSEKVDRELPVPGLRRAVWFHTGLHQVFNPGPPYDNLDVCVGDDGRVADLALLATLSRGVRRDDKVAEGWLCGNTVLCVVAPHECRLYAVGEAKPAHRFYFPGWAMAARLEDDNKVVLYAWNWKGFRRQLALATSSPRPLLTVTGPVRVWSWAQFGVAGRQVESVHVWTKNALVFQTYSPPLHLKL